MLDFVIVCGAPPMTSYLWLLILFWSLHGQPALSDLVFSTRPEDGVGMLGAPLSLHCAVYDSSSQRALSVRWGRANREPAALGPDPDNGIHQMDNGTLFFPKLRERDLGSYACYGGSGAKKISTVVQVMIADLDKVFFSPPSQTVSEGQAVFLQCVSGDSSPPADITWLKDNIPFTKGTQIQGQYGGGNQRKTSGTLHISNVSIEDQGEYICVTHNPLLNTSQESKAATLTIQGVPTRLQITEGPDNITVAIETEASMHCAVRGFPAATVQWFKDSRLLTNGSGVSLQDRGQLLVFRNVSEGDEGSYYCEAWNDREMVRSQTAFLLPAVRGRSFVQQPANRTVRKGEPVTLVCRPPYSRAPSPVSWFKNNRPLTPRTHFTVRRNGDLIFRSVHDTDSGVYFCRAFDVHLNRFVNSRTARLTVLDPPSVRLWPPVVTVPVGATVVFHCQVWGLPLPSITWSKQGRSTQTGGKILVGVRNATLSIQSVRSYDEGTYTCEASNTVGHDQRKATLRVAVSPIIVFFTGAVRSSEGSSVVMPCRAVGEVPIRYIWTRGHSQASIIRTPKRHVDDDGALHISNIEVSDAGDYHCTAENRAGRQQRTVMLTISAKDNTADRDKQHSQSLYSVTNHEAEQRTPLPTVQRIETTQSNVPLQGKGSVRASPRNSSKDLTPASTLDTLRLLGSLRQSASGLTGLFGGQTRHLGPTDLHSHLLLDSANSTQRAVTQIHPPVLQPLLPPPPPPLYQPLELLRRLQVILPPTTLAYNLPPVTSQDSFPQRQYVFPQFGSPSIDNQPSIMHILYQVTDQPINPIVNLTKSLVSLQHPSTHSLDQSNDSLSQPREPVTPFLLTPTLHFDSITQNHRSVTQSPLLDPPIQHPSPLTQFSVLKINRQQHPTQTQPSQPQPKPHQIQPQTSQPPSQPHQNQPQPSQPHHKPFQTQPQQSQLHQTQPQPSQNQLQTHQTQPQPSHTLPQPHQTQPQPSQPHSQPHQNQPQPSQTHSQPHQNQPQPSQPHSQPHQNQPQPSQPHSQPYQTQPQPSQQSQLHQTQPQPSQNQPQTHQTQAQPSQTQSQLHQTQPQPSQPQHKPHQTQPQTQTQTEPDQGQPSQPQPQLSPTPLQPSQTQPEHTQTLPEPTRIQSKTLETLTKPSQNQSEQSQNQPEPSQNKFEQLPNQPKPTQTQPQTSQTQPELSQTQANYRLTRDPQGRSVPYTATPEPLRQNVSYPANPDHPAETTRPTDTEPTEWLKRNTSQSPMRTSEDSRVKPPPPWLPVLEKHDIPIVVGVGVSLAFIFITMAFYSLVQKNEPAPAFRVPRNMGVPCRHAERLAAGRTYENRAFEGDDLEAVIEQSPNTSDTRAVPPAPSPVAVTIDPASDETGPTSEHSVVAETYPEPSEETMVDPFLDEEKSCSLSHPSIQLQCVEDWSGGGVEHGQHQGRDVLPEPPSTSHSPSPPPEREESLRSTLTLQTAEPRLTPIHHSVSISHSNAPLLLSHCVSLGHTTVAVDVHFYPAVPASGAAAATVAAATQINANAATGRGPHLGSRVAHLQEHDQIGCRPAPE